MTSKIYSGIFLNSKDNNAVSKYSKRNVVQILYIYTYIYIITQLVSSFSNILNHRIVIFCLIFVLLNPWICATYTQIHINVYNEMTSTSFNTTKKWFKLPYSKKVTCSIPVALVQSQVRSQKVKIFLSYLLTGGLTDSVIVSVFQLQLNAQLKIVLSSRLKHRYRSYNLPCVVRRERPVINSSFKR